MDNGILGRARRMLLQVLLLAFVALALSSCNISINAPDSDTSESADENVSGEGELDGLSEPNSGGGLFSGDGGSESSGDSEIAEPQDSPGGSESPGQEAFIDLPQAPSAQPSEQPPPRTSTQTSPQQNPTGNTEDQYATGNTEDQYATPQAGNTVESSGQEIPTEDFIYWVAQEVEALWADMYVQAGEEYYTPNFVIAYEPVADVCGEVYVPADEGPIYCFGNSTIYIPPDYPMGDKQQAMGEYGDFALAAIIAHEWGHHLQNLPMAKGQQPSSNVSAELQADCFAGVWAQSAYYKGQLEPGDFEEAISLLHDIGDDALGVPPEEWTHGGSQERRGSFVSGYNTGDASQCLG